MQLIEHVEQQTAMGGVLQIGLALPHATDTRLLFDSLWYEVFRFEKSASRFIHTSELTQLNQQSGLKHPVSQHFRAALLSARKSAVKTEGLFNPFTLPAVQRTGYIASVTASDKSVVNDVRDRHITDYQQLEIGDDWVRIPYGTAIDLGGCGKGYIVDILADIAKSHGARGGWIEASGDIYAWGKDAQNLPITIAVQNAFTSSPAYNIHISDAGLGVATSGTFARPGQLRDEGVHHIIDPRADRPATTDLCLATVTAATGIEADVLASSAIILGSRAAPAFLDAHRATDWILQLDNHQTITHGTHVVAAVTEVHHA